MHNVSRVREQRKTEGAVTGSHGKRRRSAGYGAIFERKLTTGLSDCFNERVGWDCVGVAESYEEFLC